MMALDSLFGGEFWGLGEMGLPEVEEFSSTKAEYHWHEWASREHRGGKRTKKLLCI